MASRLGRLLVDYRKWGSRLGLVTVDKQKVINYSKGNPSRLKDYDKSTNRAMSRLIKGAS